MSNDVIISVRMPNALVESLKTSPSSKFYIDVSENIRSILRRKWTESKNPELEEIKRVRSDISNELKRRNETLIQKQIISELNKIKQEIKEGFK